GETHVEGLRTERTELTGDGNVRGTGEHTDWPVQAVYRAVGYLSDNLSGLPFDGTAGIVPNDGGRVIDIDGEPMPGAYVTGWIKRGPVGLIGHTKSDAAQTVEMLLSDLDSLPEPARPGPDAVTDHLSARDVAFTTWEGWERLDAHECALGGAEGRDRVKVVPREAMVRISRG
ncbi:MAG: pyridine nucleotide-disulfide oxidoreductase, partial [Nocardioidaceae bacterium]